MAEADDDYLVDGKDLEADEISKPHKKEKQKRHKKEKKHKRHKDKRRSSQDKLVDEKAKRSVSPESGEIGQIDKADDVEDISGPDAQALGDKRPAERQEGGSSPSKRLKTDHTPANGTAALLAVGVANENGDSVTEAADPKPSGSHKEAASPPNAEHADQAGVSETGDTQDKPRGDRHDRDFSKSRRRSQSPKNKMDREPSRVREKSRDRSKLSSRSRGHDRSMERHGKRHSSRDRRSSRRPRSRSLRDRRRSPLVSERRRSPLDRRRDHAFDRRRDDRDRRRDGEIRRRDDRSRRRSRTPPRGRSRRSPDRHYRESEKDRERREERRKSKEREDKEFAEKVIAQLEEKEVDEDELIEQRRRKRQELMKKLQEEKQNAEAVAAPTASQAAAASESLAAPAASPLAAAPSASDLQSIPPYALATPEREHKADSDTEDEDVDEIKEADLFRGTGSEGGDPDPDEEHQAATPSEASSDERHKVANQENKDRMGGFDMFAEDTLADIAQHAVPEGGQAAAKHGLLDQFDDVDGYYNFQVGEVVNDRYEVFATHGKGVFSTVLRARDLKPVTPKGEPIPVIGSDYPEVAIKVIRSNEIMTKAGHAEKIILQKLAGADPSNKYHVVRLLGSFSYRGHLCLVFEPLASNLRQLTKKYGQGIGLRLEAVRSMAAQMLMALHLMKQCGILHADIKPDNILINKGHNVVKICDFGSAMFTGTNEITPYLVSRFYRAPEIILGLPYDHPLDVWSIGCVVYELFTGRILFPGRTNNEMLKLIMDLKGPFPKKLLKKAQFASTYFEDDPNMSFCQMEVDPLTQRPVRRLISVTSVKRPFKARLAGQSGGTQLANLIDFLEKMLHLDPEKRITAKEALRHPFIRDGRPLAKQ